MLLALRHQSFRWSYLELFWTNSKNIIILFLSKLKIDKFIIIIYSCGIQGCMFGQFRTINNHIHCILQKPKQPETKTNRRFSLKKKSRNPYVFEVPDQNFHMVSMKIWWAFLINDNNFGRNSDLYIKDETVIKLC